MSASAVVHVVLYCMFVLFAGVGVETPVGQVPVQCRHSRFRWRASRAVHGAHLGATHRWVRVPELLREARPADAARRQRPRAPSLARAAALVVLVAPSLEVAEAANAA